MKRSSDVPARLLTATAAALLAGCSGGPTEIRRCVDNFNNVLPDTRCGGSGGPYGGHFVYGGSFRGGRVYDGHLVATDGAHVKTASGRTISRGGFGSSGRGGFFGG